jgi:lipopolysaccharide/colanic/teichoic acid biosynthesis glycosyltransferase
MQKESSRWGGPNGLAKRLFDIGASTVGLVLLAVPAAAIGVLVLAKEGQPIIFKQERPGRAGRPFVVYKFRTMSTSPGPDAERLTRFGSSLRRLSLDELPELINVMKGDMSVVGPRPLLPRYLERYSPRQARRHEVRPGITGWAQINGRNALSWEQKLEFDVCYVENWSFRLDLKILWMTVLQVVRGSGVNAPGHATMPEFLGSEDD